VQCALSESTFQDQARTQPVIYFWCVAALGIGNIHVDPARSHCNGTGYIVRHIRRRYITARTAHAANIPQSTVTDRREAGVVPLVCLSDAIPQRGLYVTDLIMISVSICDLQQVHGNHTLYISQCLKCAVLHFRAE